MIEETVGTVSDESNDTNGDDIEAGEGGTIMRWKGSKIGAKDHFRKASSMPKIKCIIRKVPKILRFGKKKRIVPIL